MHRSDWQLLPHPSVLVILTTILITELRSVGSASICIQAISLPGSGAADPCLLTVGVRLLAADGTGSPLAHAGGLSPSPAICVPLPATGLVITSPRSLRERNELVQAQARTATLSPPASHWGADCYARPLQQVITSPVQLPTEEVEDASLRPCIRIWGS